MAQDHVGCIGLRCLRIREFVIPRTSNAHTCRTALLSISGTRKMSGVRLAFFPGCSTEHDNLVVIKEVGVEELSDSIDVSNRRGVWVVASIQLALIEGELNG
jgi:hypothetical protein